MIGLRPLLISLLLGSLIIALIGCNSTLEEPPPPEFPHAIVFSSNRDGKFEIYVMNADGTNQVRLTNNPSFDYFPGWSSNGTKITFVSTRDGNREIYVMNANGSNQTRLTKNHADDHSQDWAPR